MVNPTKFLDGSVMVYAGDCLDVLDTLDENGVDSVVCDPPYHLHSIAKRFSSTSINGVGTNERRAKAGSDAMARLSKGFMGKAWDGGDVAFQVETWAKVFRVLKPGGYIVAFSSSRTFGRMSVAIEDAGFINHPMFGWIFGSGFPKAHNAAKAIDRELGTPGSVVPSGAPVRRIRPGADQNKDGSWEKLEDREYQPGSYAPGSPEAEAWSGWAYGGQATKPALEPIYVGQKPFSEKNGAANILRWGVGAMNIDGCRVGTNDDLKAGANKLWSHYRKGEASADQRYQDRGGTNFVMTPGPRGGLPKGRWPANLITDGSPEVLAAFPETPGAIRPVGPQYGEKKSVNAYGDYGPRDQTTIHGDTGSAARFFYTAKADAEDRIGSKHPTVKPLDLIQYLCRLVTPPGGTVLDPFAGTGTTGEAAWREGFSAVLIEREPEYLADIARRMDLAVNPTKRAAVVAGKGELRGAEDTPLFGHLSEEKES